VKAVLSNFDFLAENWIFLLEDAQRVEAFALRDPRTSSFYSRRTLERALQWLYRNDSALKAPYDKNLAAMIHEPTFQNNIKRGLSQDIKFIHRLGNMAVHEEQAISAQEGMQTCSALFRFLGWLARVYTRGGAAPGQFNITLLPSTEGDNKNQASVVELQKLREQLEAKEKAEAEALAKQQQTEEELTQLRKLLAELQAVKELNKKSILSSEYKEAETRDAFIDVLLREAGWNPKGENVEEYPVQGMPTETGEGFVDYVLWGSDNKPLALVEVKRTKVDPKVGKRQAELYANCLQSMTGQRPVIFYTNGYETWLWDDIEYPPRRVEGFYTRDQLQLLVNRRGSKQELLQLQPKQEIVNRPYQLEASARVMESFDHQKKRKALIVMATGTGKTRLSIGIVDLLMRANWARRVLFLADRIALVEQAKRGFKQHLPDVSVGSLLDKKDEDARVVFSTYPTMLNLIDGTKKDSANKYAVGHFDLVIIDEAHRSVYQKYGAIFDYFDSLLLGLTATPRGEVGRSTYRLFELEDNDPTFAYELDEAVEDEWLTPPRAISVPLKFQREGIKYNELSEEEQEEYELQEQFYDEEGKLITEVNAAALNQWLFNEDTVDKVLMHLMENGLKVEGGDKLGKTIIFAKNSKHADFIVERFDSNYPHYAGKFCQKIDYSVKYAQSLIDDFSFKEKMPQIAVSVDMLDTGIDVPEVLNLVFFKLMRSKIKFWQMVGRGTRLCPDLFGPGDDKKEFMIFDFCQNLEFFEANPDGYEAGLQEPIKQRIFKQRLNIAHALQERGDTDDALKELEQGLKSQMHETVDSLNTDNFIVRKVRQTVESYSQRDSWNELSERDVAAISKQLTGLPSADDDHETARRFDLMILNLQASILEKTQAQVGYQKAIRVMAANLEEKKAIPDVASQMELLLALQTDDWWADVTLPMLEGVRRKLRNLAKFVDPNKQKETVFTDFEDEFQGKGKERPIITPNETLADYRTRVEKYIRDNQDHITIRRLRNNQPISKADISSLEDLLFEKEQLLPREQYSSIYGEKPLGLLVRSVVGLDRNAAKSVFADFISRSPLTPDQMRFLNEIIERLIKNGLMNPGELFEAPFTDFHSTGLFGVMGEQQAKEVVNLISEVQKRAEVG
jgi:type I restriction enzyme R subunit